MLTVELSVRYTGNWTEELADYDAFGEFLASTFRNREYIGLFSLESSQLSEAVSVIRNHRRTSGVDVIERYTPGTGERSVATLFIRSELGEFTPLQSLLYEGFLPVGPTVLEEGRERFTLLVSDREALANAVELLEEFGDVTLERVSEEFSREVTPSAAGWQELLGSVPPRRLEVLNTAVEGGYYEIPRGVTLEQIAEEAGITKTTASNHLRKAERQMVSFLLPYLNLAADGPR